MAYVLLGILGVAIVASFFVAYMSARTWPIYQAVLVVFVFLGGVAFFYLGARTLATHRAWRNLVREQENQLAQLHSQIVPLVGGVDAQGHNVRGTIAELKHELALLTSARGGVYYDVTAESIKDGVVQLTLTPPAPARPAPDPNAPEQPVPEQPAPDQPAEQPPFAHGLAPNTVVYAFDRKAFSEGGRYLGEFKVVAAPQDSPAVQVTANLPLTDAQQKRLDAAVKGAWTLYTTMPVDDAAVFSGLDESARSALLGTESAAEYGRADRALRDYQSFFHEHYVQRSLLSATIALTTNNIDRTQAATQEAEKEIAYRETEKTNLQSDLERFQVEVKAIAAYQKSVEDELAKTRAQLRETYIENRRAAAAIARDQFEKVEEINTRSAAAQPAR
jgi:hypothetical protein